MSVFLVFQIAKIYNLKVAVGSSQFKINRAKNKKYLNKFKNSFFPFQYFVFKTIKKSVQLNKLKDECERFSSENEIYKMNLSQIQVN